MTTPEILWEPQPGPQTGLLECPVEDVLFGGARGGSKTDGLIGDWMEHQATYGKDARGLFIRRTYPELEEIERRTAELYPSLGAEYSVSRHVWKFPNGSSLRLRHLNRDQDVDHFQGHSYTVIYIDEMTQFPSPEPLDKLWATLRSAAGVPCCLRATANPGGPGHNWVKKRYIDPSPPYQPFTDSKTRIERVFIPSLLENNPALTRKDPDYWRRVEAAAGGRDDLIKAWRYGLWDIVAGGMFDDLWRPETHVIEPFIIPAEWQIDRGFDWGSSKPFAVLWFAESNGECLADGRVWPRGTVFVIAELYGSTGEPDVGLRLANSEISRRVLETDRLPCFAGRVHSGPADDMIFSVTNGTSIADDMARAGVRWERSEKGAGSRVTGWQKIRQMLQASISSREEPGLYVFFTCRHLIRTLPVLPRDRNNQDDADTTAEDHLADALRYRLTWKRRTIEARKIEGF